MGLLETHRGEKLRTASEGLEDVFLRLDGQKTATKWKFEEDTALTGLQQENIDSHLIGLCQQSTGHAQAPSV